MESNDLLTTSEAAEIKGWTARYIVKLVKAGRLAALQKGGRYLIRREDLEHIKPSERPPGRPPKESEE